METELRYGTGVETPLSRRSGDLQILALFRF
jgi:hypothetical protein